jgi:hypothetical protein
VWPPLLPALTLLMLVTQTAARRCLWLLLPALRLTMLVVLAAAGQLSLVLPPLAQVLCTCHTIFDQQR